MNAPGDGYPAAGCDAFEALATRRSVRAFLPEAPVPRETIERILALAARAPSGSNIQPWKVTVVAGAARVRLCARIREAFESDAPGHGHEYAYYPEEWFEPYLSRRRALGKSLYQLTGVARGDAAAMKCQHGRNYVFFDAPVGLVIRIDRRLEVGSWLDLGTFLMGVMVAARGFGLHTCAQQAFARFHRVVRAELGIPESEYVVCGMAVGYEDPRARENTLATERAPVDDFAAFRWE
jgi:nitroreductase